ncbi:D-aminoacid aminotransferase-like PLP-dependent enzyme [Polychaeton citri CBS 116435]|uniref:D-aminoacid aminotransferase-like PLP-dependent enzyme n=1 Tax=Polychaeton citri CBS 116435 TaxID=1314669 RepID=A0A9P4Q7A5_9PEZI|nr:D-aminoacid aminotransferase-like PLP-dependent enzyme [Polychaeton citri CBS 116435]
MTLTIGETKAKSHGATHDVVPNAKNETILVGMRDGVTGAFTLRSRIEATVSVFDSNFLVGDGIWEGLRVKSGRVQFAKEHLNRLFQSAKGMAMDLGTSKEGLLNMIHQTIDANGMENALDIHLRLVISRGLKITPYQNPSVNVGLPLIVIIPEYKAVDPTSRAKGLKLVTSHIRRGRPDVKDEMWNHISKATDIQACIGANVVGADEALMLDPLGFVKTCNSTNFFIVREGEVWAPTRQYQMAGITRAKTIQLCKENGIPLVEQDFTLTETYGADEAFVTGTFPSHLMVREIDGRTIGDGSIGPITKALAELYQKAVKRDVSRSREDILAALA